MAAATAVFDTAELLEAILLQTPPKDLLLAQRVCRKWRNVIQGSVQLKQALFLPTLTSKVVHQTQNEDGMQGYWRAEGEESMHFALNPMLDAVFNAATNFTFTAKHKRIRNYFHFALSRTAISASTLTGGASDTESWNEMFLTRPPCATVILNCYVYGGCLLGSLPLYNESGVRLRDIFAEEVRTSSVQTGLRGLLARNYMYEQFMCQIKTDGAWIY